MTQKKRKTNKAKPSEGDRHLAKQFPLRMPQEVRDILEQEANKNFRKLTQEIMLAIKKHLEDKGHSWPDY